MMAQINDINDGMMAISIVRHFHPSRWKEESGSQILVQSLEIILIKLRRK